MGYPKTKEKGEPQLHLTDVCEWLGRTCKKPSKVYPNNLSEDQRELLLETKTKLQDRYNQVDKEELDKLIQKVK